MSRGDASELLGAAEQVLDCFAVSVEHRRKAVLPASVGERVDLGRAPATRSANSLAMLPPFRPRPSSALSQQNCRDKHLGRRTAYVRKSMEEIDPDPLIAHRIYGL